jgi:hypothetical protein
LASDAGVHVTGHCCSAAASWSGRSGPHREIIDSLREVVSGLRDIFDYLREAVSRLRDIFDYLREAVSGLSDIFDYLPEVVSGLSDIFDYLPEVVRGLSDIFDYLRGPSIGFGSTISEPIRPARTTRRVQAARRLTRVFFSENGITAEKSCSRSRSSSRWNGCLSS